MGFGFSWGDDGWEGGEGMWSGDGLGGCGGWVRGVVLCRHRDGGGLGRLVEELG